MNKSKEVRRIALTGLLSAMVFIATFFIKIPIGGNGHYIHIGDSMIYLAACLLPMRYAVLVGAIGAGLADAMWGAMIWVIPTMLIKPLITIWFTSKKDRFICKRNCLAIVLGGMTGIAGYLVAEWILYGDIRPALIMVPLNSIQPIVSGILFIVLGYVFDRMGLHKKLHKKTMMGTH